MLANRVPLTVFVVPQPGHLNLFSGLLLGLSTRGLLGVTGSPNWSRRFVSSEARPLEEAPSEGELDSVVEEESFLWTTWT